MTDEIEILGPELSVALGSSIASAEYRVTAQRARAERWAERLHDRDTTLWSNDGAVQATIADRLGWLAAPAHFALLAPTLEAFAEARRDEGIRAVVVAGMGGSSLAPDVLQRTFGSAEGWPIVRILDSTDPAAVAAAVDDLDPLTTLFIVATKSGTTTEPLAFQADAWDRLEKAIEGTRSHAKPGDFMVAITDPGHSVAAIPHHDELRELFLNPPDIGGRYSAVSYVGLVPAALMGLDIEELLASAEAMLATSHDNDVTRNPSLGLGLALGVLALGGRDKVTLISDPEIASFGAWVEQLIAESTGKHGVGIVPVDLEPVGVAAAYGSDRVFVRLSVGGSAGLTTPDGHHVDTLVEELEAAGHPIVRIHLPDAIDLGGEFVRWEVATAIAGIVLAINPFDQPNVEEAKALTRRLLAEHDASSAEVPQRELPEALQGIIEPAVVPPSDVPILASSGPISLIGDTALHLGRGDGTPVGELRRHLARLRPAGYAALQAYIAPTPARDATLARVRVLIRDATRRATTLGYGPRFLHSTGQLHKGGPATGWFLQLTADHPVDRAIPDAAYTFGELIDAQAQGDFQALEAHDLPALRVHLGPDPDAGLAELEQLLGEALGPDRAPSGSDGGTNA